jgi:hypothetical protein
VAQFKLKKYNTIIMPRVFYEDELTQDEYNVSMLTDDELTQLMNKYKEKLQRYTIFLNEEFERTERKILIIHQEQVKRFNRMCYLDKNK